MAESNVAIGLHETIDWIDMSQAGVYLTPFTLANSNKVLLLLDCNNVFEKDKLAQAMFEPVIIENQEALSNRLYMRDLSQKTIRPRLFIELGLPNELIRIIKLSLVEIDVLFKRHVARFTSNSLENLLSTKTLLGLNFQENEVYASPFSRFYFTGKNNENLYIEKREPNGEFAGNPLFLRATKRKDIYPSVQGFFMYMLRERQSINHEDIRKFTALITQKKNTTYDLTQVTSTQLVQVTDTLDVVITDKFSNLDLNTQSSFSEAISIFNKTPIKNFTNLIEGLAELSTPLPLAIIAQRLLVNDNEGDVQQTILEPCIGHGSLIAQLAQKRKYTIVGTETDGVKRSNLNRTSYSDFIQIWGEDAQYVDFEKLNASNKYDYTISNFPCLRINQELIGRLNSEPFETITTRRLDHYLLIRTLRARKDEGRSVFLFLADTQSSKGDLSPAMLMLANFIYERYKVEDFIEISSNLYSRQGSKNNIRMLVIGERYVNTITDRDLLLNLIPKKLKIINDYETLWSWSQAIIARRDEISEDNYENAQQVEVFGNATIIQNFNERFINTEHSDDFDDHRNISSLVKAPIISADLRQAVPEHELEDLLSQSSIQVKSSNDINFQDKNVLEINHQLDSAAHVVSERDPFEEDQLEDSDNPLQLEVEIVESTHHTDEPTDDEVAEVNFLFDDEDDDENFIIQDLSSVLSPLNDNPSEDENPQTEEFEPTTSSLDKARSDEQLEVESVSSDLQEVSKIPDLVLKDFDNNTEISDQETQQNTAAEDIETKVIKENSPKEKDPNTESFAFIIEEEGSDVDDDEDFVPLGGFKASKQFVDENIDLDKVQASEIVGDDLLDEESDIDSEKLSKIASAESENDLIINSDDNKVSSVPDINLNSKTNSNQLGEENSDKQSLPLFTSVKNEDENEVLADSSDIKNDDSNEPVIIKNIHSEAGKSSTVKKHKVEAQYEDSDYQQPYIAESRVSLPISMIPKNLATALYRARDALVEYIELSTKPTVSEVFIDESGQHKSFEGRNHYYNPKFASFYKNGDFLSFIDAYVAYNLEYSNHQELAEVFACEQVDAIAIAISQHKSNRGMWVGDQTGLGKGRVAAGMLRYAKLQGMRPFFFTLNAQLFNDIWRDICETKSDHLFKKPFIFNANASIAKFGTSEILHTGTNIPKSLKKIDDSYDIVISSYFQFNRKNYKTDILLDSINESSFLIMDESHKAAGEDSNTGQTFLAAQVNAGAVLYSSATGIKTSNNLPFYFRLFPSSISRDRIVRNLKGADEAVLELISYNLASDGTMIRREQDFSKVKFETEEPSDEIKKEIMVLSDSLSLILSDMDNLSTFLKKDLNEEIAKTENKFLATYIAKYGTDYLDEDQMDKGIKVQLFNFGSRLYDIQRQFMLAVKTGLAIQMAVQVLQNGQKPVIGLESTGESLFNKIMAMKLNEPDSNGVRLSDIENEITKLEAEILDAEEKETSTSKQQLRLAELQQERSKRIETYLSDMEQPPLFKEMLLLMLDSLNTARVVDKEGNYVEIVLSEENRSFMEAKKQLREKINNYPSLPFMPIDIIRNELSKAGYKCGAILGSSLRMVQNHETGRWRAEYIKANDIRERIVQVDQFQSGELDAMILTRAGSTGISLHAVESRDPNIPSDHLRQRVFINLQAPLDIVEYMQLLGRVARRGQYSAPIVKNLLSGLPSEARINLMHMRKLAALSANTTSNRESQYSESEVPDMLNEIGNKICLEYLTDNPEVAGRFNIQLPSAKDKKDDKDKTKYVNLLLSKLIMVPVHQQEMVFQDVAERFNEYVKDLEAAGKNPLRIQVLNWRAKELETHILKRGALDVSVVNHFGLESAFDEPLIFKKIGYTQDLNPIRTQDFGRFFEAAEKSMFEQLDGILNVSEDGLSSEPIKYSTLSEAINAYSDALHQLMLKKFSASVKSTVINSEGEFVLVGGPASEELMKKYFKEGCDANDPYDLNIKPRMQSIRDGLEVLGNSKLIESFENAQLVVKTLRDFSKMYGSENRHGIVLPVYSPSLESSITVSGAVLTRIHFPSLRTNAVVPSAFKFDCLFPGEDEEIQISMSYMFNQSLSIRQSMEFIKPSFHATEVREQILKEIKAKNKIVAEDKRIVMHMKYYNINDLQERLLKNSFDRVREGRVQKTANIISGNLFKAKTLLDNSVPHSSIIYTNEFGVRERGFLVSSKFTFDAMEDSIYHAVNTDQLSYYIDALHQCDVPFSDYPEITLYHGKSVLTIKYQDEHSSIVMIKGTTTDLTKYLETDQIFKTDLKGHPHSLNLTINAANGIQSSKTIHAGSVPWAVLSEFIRRTAEVGYFLNGEVAHFHPYPLEVARVNLHNKLNAGVHQIVSSSEIEMKQFKVAQTTNYDTSIKSPQQLFESE